VDGDRDETIGFQYTEWALRPGTPLYVLGEVHDRAGALVIGPPSDRKQHFVVSTRSEEQLTASARSRQRWLSRIGAGAGVVGLVLVVLGIAL
jgi:E3 Ubiquitin ligase